MPNPHSAKPAKPAPSVSTMSRWSAGTAFAFAVPWISTNWARTNLTWLSLRNFFAVAGVMLLPSQRDQLGVPLRWPIGLGQYALPDRLLVDTLRRRLRPRTAPA